MYETIEHTADILVKCKGDTLEECFESAAYAMFDQMIDISTAEKKIVFHVEIEKEDIEDRLYSFLSELLFIMDSESAVMSDFKVSFEKNKLFCEAYGEKFDPSIHKPKTEIKAVTYHMMKIDENEPSVTVLFDV